MINSITSKYKGCYGFCILLHIKCKATKDLNNIKINNITALIGHHCTKAKGLHWSNNQRSKIFNLPKQLDRKLWLSSRFFPTFSLFSHMISQPSFLILVLESLSVPLFSWSWDATVHKLHPVLLQSPSNVVSQIASFMPLNHSSASIVSPIESQ